MKSAAMISLKEPSGRLSQADLRTRGQATRTWRGTAPLPRTSASSKLAAAIAHSSAARSSFAVSSVSSTPARAPGSSLELMKSSVMTSPAREPLHQPGDDCRQQRVQRLLGGCGRLDELRYPVGVAAVHPVQHQAMQMDVQARRRRGRRGRAGLGRGRGWWPSV
jgi:hypothetical protein